MNLKTQRTNTMVVSWLLRVGLAVVFLYAAVQAFREPVAWEGFLPLFTTHFVSLKTALDIISVVQIILAGWLLIGKYLRLASLVAVALLGGILVFNLGALYVTFRDFGLLCMAAALWFVAEK